MGRKKLRRRQFLERAASGAVGLGLTAAAYGRVPGAGERLGIGFMGCGGRGHTLMDYFQKRKDVEIRAVCDVYEPRLRSATAKASPTGRPFADYRQLLEVRDVDAVVVATPDHWHAAMVIDAVQAGKDAYVEKPLCHTIDEGFRMVDAVRKAKAVVQVGTQRRSYDLFLEGKKIMDAGQTGPVKLVTAWWYNQTLRLSSAKLEGKLDWDRWLGLAPRRPVDPLRFFNWYYFWDYSGGLMVGQAAHVVDVFNWFIESRYPAAVTAAACKTHLEGAEVPETTNMAIEYPEDYLAVFTLGYQAMRYVPPHDLGKSFHGTRARFDIGREHFALYPAQMERQLEAALRREQFGTFPEATTAHVANFLDCVRTRRDPNATVEMGQWTNVALCLAMQSIRSGRRVRYNAEKRQTEM